MFQPCSKWNQSIRQPQNIPEVIRKAFKLASREKPGGCHIELPEDIAKMALFLASDESEWVTGTAQVVDGGLTVGKPWRKQPRTMTEVRPIYMYDV